MKRFFLLVAIVIIGYAGWYFAGPLLVDKVVDEALPFAEIMDRVEKDVDAVFEKVDEIKKMPEEMKMKLEKTVVEKMALLPATEVEEKMPVEPKVVRTASFKDADDFHKGSGVVKQISLPDGSSVLRFENFSVTNGPQLHVYLARDAQNVKAGFVDLGPLKGNKGNQNYTLLEGTDVGFYKHVVIYCVPFGVVFATASF